MKLPLLLLGAIAVASAQQRPPRNMVVPSGTTASITCSVAGSRCLLTRADFGTEVSAPFGTVQESVGGTVFTALTLEDTLQVSDCLSSQCIVVCNDQCSCATDDGSPCLETTAAPTPAPTPAPVQSGPVVCPRSTDTSMCSKLMPAVPIGTFCDCYNFCQGVFISCCEQSGQCGSLDCEAPEGETLGEPGTLTGQVLGCTDEDRPPGNTGLPGDTSGEGASSGTSMCVAGSAVAASMITAAAML